MVHHLWYPVGMLKRTVSLTRSLFLLCILLASTPLFAQRERQMAPPESGDFGSKFFTELRNIFGRFRDSDLERAFQLAEPMQCTELLSGKGEWRPVAFFNRKRSLGDWYRSNINEVREDLSVYIFKGNCQSEHGNIELTTKYPVGDSIDAYNAGQIPFNQIDVNVNAPVRLTFDSRSGAYVFDLPFLYLVKRQGATSIYSLIPPHFGDRYTTEVTNAWECKSVSSLDITYSFLICRTSTVDRSSRSRSQPRSSPDDGSLAYFILSDGSEAHSTVTLKFEDAPSDPPPPAATAPTAPTAPVETGAIGWQAPDYRSAMLDVEKTEFRIRFSPAAWTNRIGSSQVVSNQSISSLQTARLADGADYCAWSPASPTLASRLVSETPDEDVAFTVSGADRGTGQSTASITFTMKSLTGSRIGALQCFFQRIEKASAVSYDRWTSIVGSQMKLEVRPGQ